jgi:hypothetical protein
MSGWFEVFGAEHEKARTRFAYAVSTTVYSEADMLNAMSDFILEGGTPGVLRLLTRALTPEAREEADRD